jgi:spore photoproduct lyase
MIPYRPARIIVQQEAHADSLTGEILARLRGIPVETVHDVDLLLPELLAASDWRGAGKRFLILARNKGSFMKPCPGAGAEICCNYWVINYALNCHFECTYCILQSFLNNPALTVYTNLEDLEREVKEKAAAAPADFFRIGTGETSDSLALDDITRHSPRLVRLFRALPNAVLELKTKSDRIANLRELDHGGHTVISWSLNPERMIRSEEFKTASLEERLRAACQCRAWGYKVGFHFDPLIWYEGWEDDYRQLVRELFQHVDPGGVCWISLGCLRFTHDLKEIVRSRFPHSRIPHGEFVPGNHHKLRYFRPVRDEMYGKMRAWIREEAPEAFVYLCMESRMAWERGFARVPESSAGLAAEMDRLVDKRHPGNRTR